MAKSKDFKKNPHNNCGKLSLRPHYYAVEVSYKNSTHVYCYLYENKKLADKHARHLDKVFASQLGPDAIRKNVLLSYSVSQLLASVRLEREYAGLLTKFYKPKDLREIPKLHVLYYP
jgi:hypothetical protein